MPGAEIETQVAVMAETVRNHLRSDEQTNERIDVSLIEIKTMVNDLGAVLRGSTQRVHEQREEAIKMLRDEIATVDDKAVAAYAGVDKIKIWTLTGVVIGLASGLTTLFNLLTHMGRP